MANSGSSFPQLHHAAYSYPLIDNHAHPLLKAETRSALPFEGVISEAEGEALTQDAVNTLACLRAAKQLGKLYNLGEGASWEDVKIARDGIDYDVLCKACMEPTGIQCILIDDGLGEFLRCS